MDKDCWVEYQHSTGTYEVNLSRLSYLALTKENMELICSLPDDAAARIIKAIYRYAYNGCAPAEDNLNGIEGTIAKMTLDAAIRIAFNSYNRMKGLNNQNINNVIRRIDDE